ncbi:hypothetical protein [Herbaspirillum huttiense]|uniref:hypothetical protein n=1 Tax=Herbaspirillum huttiense TaxID=863372 RepID=UPI0021769984|nr:hypothetical protein [Herbaspirillum huttiense]UWE14940.1 hypothetical protein NY669_17765 [Herbaspirillum huttiense]
MLQDYFDQLKCSERTSSALYDHETVVKKSELFAFHPVVQELHGYVLDDENTSNHHLLITAGPLAGSVFFLSHDDDSRVVFENTADFLDAVGKAETEGLSVTDLHPRLSPVAKDQIALAKFIRELLSRECNDLVVCLLPSLDLADLSLLQLLANDDDFFLGEAVAMEIEKRPSKVLLPVAAICADHRHPQISIPGLRAVRSIQRLP